MTRPSLEETVYRRAWSHARLISLGTLGGALLLAIFAKLGDELVEGVAGTVIGFVVGVAGVLVVSLALAARRQRDALRDYIKRRDEREGVAATFKGKCMRWAQDVFRICEIHDAKYPKPAQIARDQLYRALKYGPTP